MLGEPARSAGAPGAPPAPTEAAQQPPADAAVAVAEAAGAPSLTKEDLDLLQADTDSQFSREIVPICTSVITDAPAAGGSSSRLAAATPPPLPPPRLIVIGGSGQGEGGASDFSADESAEYIVQPGAGAAGGGARATGPTAAAAVACPAAPRRSWFGGGGGRRLKEFEWAGELAPQVADLAAAGAAAGWLISDLSEIALGPALGAGSSGETRRGVWRGRDVAVKCLRICGGGGPELACFLREVACWSATDHPGVVRFLGAALQGPNGCWVVSELMEGGTLDDRLHRIRSAKKWPLWERLERAREIAEALAALTSGDLPIMHRDVKPSNILLGADGKARLADFGFSRHGQGGGDDRAHYTSETGTYLYMAPECIRHEPYSTSADVWSFGVMLWELTTRQRPYSNSFLTPAQIAVGVSLGRLRPQPPPTTQAPLANLIFCCCDLDPGARPRFAEVADKLSEILDQIRPQDEVSPLPAAAPVSPDLQPLARKVPARSVSFSNASPAPKARAPPGRASSFSKSKAWLSQVLSKGRQASAEAAPGMAA